MDKWHRVIYVRSQGYGKMTPEAWAQMPERHRERITVLELCDDEAGAREALDRRLQTVPDWNDKPGLHYAHGEWYQEVPGWPGIYAPVDRELPVITVASPSLIAGILDKPPEARTCADRRVLERASIGNPATEALGVAEQLAPVEALFARLMGQG